MSIHEDGLLLAGRRGVGGTALSVIVVSAAVGVAVIIAAIC
jgi:hypothetical protein